MSDEGLSMGANLSLSVKRADGTEDNRLVLSDIEINPELLEMLERLKALTIKEEEI